MGFKNPDHDHVDTPEKAGVSVRKAQQKAIKDIQNPGDRLVARANVADEYRKSHGGKLPGGYKQSDR